MCCMCNAPNCPSPLEGEGCRAGVLQSVEKRVRGTLYFLGFLNLKMNWSVLPRMELSNTFFV